MKVLLDSQILLWALTDDPRLSRKAREYISDPDNFIFYSVASVWELAIKHQLHPDNIEFSSEELIVYCGEAGYESLDLSVDHILMLETLKRPEDAPKHKDPFDKMLISQAKADDMVFLTHDELLPYYGESCIVLV